MAGTSTTCSPVTIRFARPSDFDAIRAIAFASFPPPPYWFSNPACLALYTADAPRELPDGVLHVAVAETSWRGLAGYVYYQLRRDGDVYLVELAAIPPDVRDRVPLTGTNLIRHALAHGLEAGCVRATLNVPGPYGDGDPLGHRRDRLAAYYRRLRYEAADERGYRLDGSPRFSTDLWMCAAARGALMGVDDFLASSSAAGGEDAQIQTRKGTGPWIRSTRSTM